MCKEPAKVRVYLAYISQQLQQGVFAYTIPTFMLCYASRLCPALQKVYNVCKGKKKGMNYPPVS